MLLLDVFLGYAAWVGVPWVTILPTALPFGYLTWFLVDLCNHALGARAADPALPDVVTCPARRTLNQAR